MPSLSAILALIALLGPVAAWAGTTAVHRLDAAAAARAAATEKAAAVKAAHDLAAVQCAAEKQALERAKTEELARAVEDAVTAADGIGPTPVDKMAIEDLCLKSASCRDRTDVAKSRGATQ